MSKIARAIHRSRAFSAMRLKSSRIGATLLTQMRLNSSAASTSTSEPSDLVLASLRKYMRWYPQDAVTYSTIQTYLDLRTSLSRTQSLLVGVVYENDRIKSSSKMLEALLADPLATNNEQWFSELERRPRDINNMIAYSHQKDSELLLPESFQRTTNKLSAQSPILSADHRPTYPQALKHSESKPNDLILLEVNREADVSKLVDVCHFFIYVTGEFSTLMDMMPRHVQKKILLTVVDNLEYSPLSSESSPVTFDTKQNVTHHAVKINSTKLLQSTHDYLEQGTRAGSAYFESLQESNVIELSKFLLWFLRTENLSEWLFKVIRDEIAQNTLLEQYIKKVYEDLRLNSLASCSNSMHEELQKSFIPQTNEFFRKKLRWWKLYWKNDNVEYALKDYFMANFMPKSISGYNYVKGQLVARLQEQKYAKYPNSFDHSSPLEAFKQRLINERILLEVQLVVYSSIMNAFITYQLPLTVLSLVGYGWFGLQAETAMAVTALGWVIGFNQVSKQWYEFTHTWLQNLYEEVRLVISKGCIDNGLLKELNARYEGAKDLARIKREVAETLARADRK